MENKKIEWGMEAVQLANEIADTTKDIGIPGIGIIGKFAQKFYNNYLVARFSNFCKNAQIDEDLISKIQNDENYSNCFYSVLETVRKTHSKIGLTVLALIYKDFWNNSEIIIPAMRSFSEISDSTILSFVELYESIPVDEDCIFLLVGEGDNKVFHHLYKDAVELINRNIFLQSAGMQPYGNAPIQGMKWEHTDLYYKYCIKANKYIYI